MPNSIDNLSASLQTVLKRLLPSGDQVRLTQFQKLSARNDRLSQQFDEGAIPPPSKEQRLVALSKLHRQQLLTRKDWRLISWGLNDSTEAFESVLEDTIAYRWVHSYFSEEISNAVLPRKCWFGLANGYFGYENDQPHENPNWKNLANLLEQGFLLLAKQQRKERPWVLAIKPHLDLFGSKPGVNLAKAMAAGDSSQWEELQKHLPIPESSWLWHRIIEAHLEYIASLDDDLFLNHIQTTLKLGESRPVHADKILAALLTRYASSRHRETTESSLQEAALQHWGSPQIGQRVGMWERNVSEDVRRMVLKWFAKEDLIHFFSLLQGESGVDQSRLDYWMRFVGQMSYTRVVLGLAAQQNRSPEYIEFKKKNKGRYSVLSGGTRDDNAFVMQIGRYYFVEFSRKGNACYYYDGRELTENLSDTTLSMYGHLKSGKGDKINHMAGWQHKLDTILESFGIFPDKEKSVGDVIVAAGQDFYAGKSQIGMVTVSAGMNKSRSIKDDHSIENCMPKISPNSSGGKANFDEAISMARLRISLEQTVKPPIEYDARSKGGAFWFETKVRYPRVLDRQLFSLGFKYKPGRGYWIN